VSSSEHRSGNQPRGLRGPLGGSESLRGLRPLPSRHEPTSFAQLNLVPLFLDTKFVDELAGLVECGARAFVIERLKVRIKKAKPSIDSVHRLEDFVPLLKTDIQVSERIIDLTK
jgi:hypothetical protein